MITLILPYHAHNNKVHSQCLELYSLFYAHVYKTGGVFVVSNLPSNTQPVSTLQYAVSAGHNIRSPTGEAGYEHVLAHPMF